MAFKKSLTVEIPRELVARIEASIPGADIADVTLKSLKRLLGEIELRKFAALKQAEIRAEAQRLDEELGLKDANA